jgi:hypothetical protein
MKVRELIRILSKMPQDSIVVLQKDGEGNGYSPLSGADADSVYVPDSTYSGDAYHKDWSADDCCMDATKWQRVRYAKKYQSVILFPVN